jgi:hypothetical protein
MGDVIDIFTGRRLSGGPARPKGAAKTPARPKGAKTRAPAKTPARQQTKRKGGSTVDVLLATVRRGHPDDDDLLGQPGALYLRRDRSGDITWAQFDCEDGCVQGVELTVTDAVERADSLSLLDTDGVRWLFDTQAAEDDDAEDDDAEDDAEDPHPFNRRG